MPGAGRQDLKRFKKFNNAILFVIRESLKGFGDCLGFTCVGQHGFSQGCELSMMESGRSACRSPESLGQKSAVTREELD